MSTLQHFSVINLAIFVILIKSVQIVNVANKRIFVIFFTMASMIIMLSLINCVKLIMGDLVKGQLGQININFNISICEFISLDQLWSP